MYQNAANKVNIAEIMIHASKHIHDAIEDQIFEHFLTSTPSVNEPVNTNTFCSNESN